MQNRHPQKVEDYTNANLVLILVNLFWVFGVVWSTWGIGPVVILGLVLNHMINRLAVIRLERARANAPLSRQVPTDRV